MSLREACHYHRRLAELVDKAPIPTEHEEQATLIDWWAYACEEYLGAPR